MDALDAYLEEHRQRHLDELFDFLRIPSISTDAANRDDVRRCAEHLVAHFERLGMQVELCETTGHPIVLAQWRQAGDGAPTVIFYGHYDVQPVDPVELWDSPPFEPTVKNGAVIARGASDDKGQVFAHLKGLEMLRQLDGDPPVNLVFVVEGEEECGSANLEPFLQAHREQLEGDVVLVSDTTLFAPERPAIVCGLRGLAYVQINVQGPARDLHSGTFGGAVDNPIQALCEMLSQLKDRQGRVLIPGFYDDVRALASEERDELAALPFDEAAFLDAAGAPAFGEAGFSTVERIGARPTLDVNGIWGGFTGQGAKTVLPAKAHAKVSMRLVPDQKPEDINRKLVETIRRLAPPTVEVSFDVMYGSEASLTERDSPYVAAAKRALAQVYTEPPVFVRGGGSIPVVSSFKRLLGLDTLLVGFGLDDDRIHSPNEKFDLVNFESAIRFSYHFWREAAAAR